MENLADNVYPAEWPGFPGETGARRQARADLYLVDDSFEGPVLPADALAINQALEAEETLAFKAADESPIYDYEVEMQRPVPPLEEAPKKPSWRARVKGLMGKATESLREASISVLATAQAKQEQFYDDEELGAKRKKITAAVAGAIAVGAVTYLGYKGLVSSGSSHRSVAEAAANSHTPSTVNGSGVEAFDHAIRIPAAEVHAAHAAAPAHETVVTVHSGDNPWTISEHHLIEQGNPNPTPAQIADYDKQIAAANPGKYTYGDDSSRYIPVGTKLRLP